MIEVNAKAPDFSLPDENGQTVKLADFRGKDVVLFFYPKANTPG
jgi:peroxiredoxin Q/BCP